MVIRCLIFMRCLSSSCGSVVMTAAMFAGLFQNSREELHGNCVHPGLSSQPGAQGQVGAMAPMRCQHKHSEWVAAALLVGPRRTALPTTQFPSYINIYDIYTTYIHNVHIGDCHMSSIHLGGACVACHMSMPPAGTACLKSIPPCSFFKSHSADVLTAYTLLRRHLHKVSSHCLEHSLHIKSITAQQGG